MHATIHTLNRWVLNLMAHTLWSVSRQMNQERLFIADTIASIWPFSFSMTHRPFYYVNSVCVCAHAGELEGLEGVMTNKWVSSGLQSHCVFLIFAKLFGCSSAVTACCRDLTSHFRQMFSSKKDMQLFWVFSFLPESSLIITYAHTHVCAHTRSHLDHQAPAATHSHFWLDWHSFVCLSVCSSVSSLQNVCLSLTVSYNSSDGLPNSF